MYRGILREALVAEVAPEAPIRRIAAGIDYKELEGVADGQAASAVFERIASGELEEGGGSVAGLRAQLLTYCELDTLVMVRCIGH